MSADYRLGPIDLTPVNLRRRPVESIRKLSFLNEPWNNGLRKTLNIMHRQVVIQYPVSIALGRSPHLRYW